VLIFILSKNLTFRYISPDAAAPFRPHAVHLGQLIETAAGLMEVDPGLSLDSRSALLGELVVPCEIGLPGGASYLRRIMLRTKGGGQTEELIISYEAGAPSLGLELAQLRKQLVDALDSVQDPFAYYDKNDSLVHHNRAYARLLDSEEGAIIAGMGFEEILRRGLRSGSWGGAVDQHEQWLRDRLVQRERQTFEEERRLHDGRWFRVTQRATAGGAYVHMLIDITDLKIAQVALQQVISGSQAATWSVNLETGKSDVNDRWTEMLGLDRGTVSSLGFKGWRSLVHPDDVAAAEAGFLQCANGSAAAFEVEYRLRHRLGHWVWVMGRGGVSDRYADGRPLQISGVLLDISRQKRLEAELAMQAAAIAATEDGITITDEAGTILHTNPAHAAMFAHQQQASLIGRSLHSLYTPQAAAELALDAFPTLREHGYWSGHANALRRDGGIFEQELSLTNMPDGKIVCVNRDVTVRNGIARERFHVRERIELAQRQEIVNLLAAGLTHDLINLIVIISHISDPDLADRRVLPKSLENIHAAARQAIVLLEAVRTLGSTKREIHESDLVELLTEAASVLRLGAPHRIKVTVDLPGEPITATLDPLRLMQVLLNLGLNGRDALGDGEQEIALFLSLSDTIPPTADLEVGNIPEKPYALFKVSDTGTGITPEVRARLWDLHFTTKGDMGTGLGLSVVAEIVREAGGAIALDTSPGVGSTFYIAWPLSPSVAPPKKYAA